MYFKTLIVSLVPLLLADPASAAPLHEREATICSVATETQLVTVTVYLEQYSPVPATSNLAVTEVGSPLATETASALATSSAAADAASSGVAPTKATSVANPVPSYSGGGLAPYRNALYFTNWGIYGANFQPQQIPAKQVSHILYAFADIAEDGTVKSSDTYSDLQKHYNTDSWNDVGNNAYGCIKQLYILKKKNRNLKVLLSIGGWTYSHKFAPVAATEAGRQKFADSSVRLVADWGFDGIDIDWEYPQNADQAKDFVLLLQACRRALDAYSAQHAKGYRFTITVASPAGPQNYGHMDLAGMDPFVDAWNLMAYDYAGSWDTTTGHQANVFPNPGNPESTKFSTNRAVDDYLARGIPAHKISMGLPLYGRSFLATAGVGKSYSDIGAGSVERGVYLYKALPRPGAVEAWDDVAKASYSYDSDTHELISYDDLASAVFKALYLKHKGLGGAVFWEASGDRTGDGSLVGAVAHHLGALDDAPNLLSYPASQYDNIRNGMS